jgi:hypothetical protein
MPAARFLFTFHKAGGNLTTAAQAVGGVLYNGKGAAG